MLELIDESLELFLRASVPLSATDVDISFEAPDREWSAKLTRPTVNLFLWDIRRSATRSRSGMRTVERDGEVVHQPANPVVELRYVITAWTTDHGDERALLSGLVRSLLAAQAIPAEYLSVALDGLDPPSLVMARAGEDHMDVFKALEGQVKPGLNVVLSTEFDTGEFLPAGPPVGRIEIAANRIGTNGFERVRRVAGEVVDAESLGAIGAVARSPGDATHVNAAGQFLLRAGEGDEIVIETEPPLAAIVPAAGGVRVG
jgi:hypothetical protein